MELVLGTFVFVAASIGVWAILYHLYYRLPKIQTQSDERIENIVDKAVDKVVQMQSPIYGKDLIKNILGTVQSVAIARQGMVIHKLFMQLLQIECDKVEMYRRDSDPGSGPGAYDDIYVMHKGNARHVISCTVIRRDAQMYGPMSEGLDMMGWVDEDGKIDIAMRIEVIAPIEECNDTCQNEIGAMLSDAILHSRVKTTAVGFPADQREIYILGEDQYGFRFNPVQHVLRTMESQLLAKSYAAPTVYFDGASYRPPIIDVAKHGSDLLGDSKNMLLYGSVGVGKTALCEHILANTTSRIVRIDADALKALCSPKGKMAFIRFVEETVRAKDKLILWIDEGQEVFFSDGDIAFLLDLMDGTSVVQAGTVSVLAAMNVKPEDLDAALVSRMDLMLELKPLKKAAAEALLQYLVANNLGTTACKTKDWENEFGPLRAVWKSVIPQGQFDQLKARWKSYKIVPPVKKTA